jgi:hypothetical protein
MADEFGDSVYESGDAVDDTDGLDPIENLMSDDPDEEMQTGYSPPEREPYSLRHPVTEASQLSGESLDQRLSEEEPDVSADGPGPGDVEPRAGRLVDAGDDPDADPLAARDAGPAGYASSAEEAAVHIEPGR